MKQKHETKTTILVDRETVSFDVDVGKWLQEMKIDADSIINIESRGRYRIIWYKKEV